MPLSYPMKAVHQKSDTVNSPSPPPQAPPAPLTDAGPAVEASDTFPAPGVPPPPPRYQQPTTKAPSSPASSVTVTGVTLLNGGHPNGQSTATEASRSPASSRTAAIDGNEDCNEDQSAPESSVMPTDRDHATLSAPMLRWLAEQPHEKPWSVHSGLQDADNNRDEQRRLRTSAPPRRFR